MLLPSFRLHPHLLQFSFSPPSGLHPRRRMYLPFIWATSSPHASLTECICLPFGLHPHWQPLSQRMLLLSHAMSSILTGVTCNIQSHRVLLSSLQDSTLTESSVSVTQGAGHTLTEITHQFSVTQGASVLVAGLHLH